MGAGTRLEGLGHRGLTALGVLCLVFRFCRAQNNGRLGFWGEGVRLLASLEQLFIFSGLGEALHLSSSHVHLGLLSWSAFMHACSMPGCMAVRLCGRMYVCMYACMYAHMHACMRVHVCISVSM